MVLLLAATFVLASIMVLVLWRTLTTVKAAPPGLLDGARLITYSGVEHKLADLVRIPTVSRFRAEDEDDEAFKRLIARIFELFPLVGQRLLRAEAGNRALLLEWPGSKASLQPVILMAHYDVVPPGDETLWDRNPFSGDIDDTYVHGRGSQDVKVTMTCALEAVERLLSTGFIPARTIYLAFGGDEETGGNRGAASIAAVLRARRVKASFILDEGGFVAKNLFKFSDRPLALVGVSEKGYVDIAISASGSGGHASMPPRHTAAGLVAKAVAMSETKQFPARITATLSRFMHDLAPYAPFFHRMLFRNLFITTPLVKAVFSTSPLTNALIRTTAAATMLSGSEKENVLPDKASAVLNVRVLPGSDVASTMARLESMVGKAGARAEFAHYGHADEPAPESPVEHEGYINIKACIQNVFPEAGVVPFMFMAGTDTKHYTDIAEALYRFMPAIQSPEDLAQVHGINERISLENVRRCCLFYEELLKGL